MSKRGLFILMLLILVNSAMAAEYYVDKDSIGGTCSDSGPGTKTQPWCTISKANQNLYPGDTAYIRKGTYFEIIEPYRSGKEGKKITYKAYPGEVVTIRGEYGKQAVIAIGWRFNSPSWDKSYIVIDGFKVLHNDPTITFPDNQRPVGILVYGGTSHDNEVRNCEVICQGQKYIYGGSESGIGVSKSSNNLIENNYIHGWCKLGIGTGGTARNNIFRNNQIVDTIYNGITFGSSKYQMQRTIVEGNFICNSLVSDSIQFQMDFDTAGEDDLSNKGVIIRDNVLCNPGENNIDLKSASEILIEGNIIYGGEGNNDGGQDPDVGDNRQGGYGGIMHGSGRTSEKVIIRNNILYDNSGGILPENDFKIYNNVIVYNNRDYTGTNSSYQSTRKPSCPGIAAWNSLGGVVIINNIIGGHKAAEIALASRGNPRIDNNIYFNVGPAKLVEYRAKYDWDLHDFTGWKSFLQTLTNLQGKDVSSMDTDPKFVDVPPYLTGDSNDFDFHLSGNSPAIDKGGFLTSTTSSGSGYQMAVLDARVFFDGWGVTDGDLIQLEGQTNRARIISIDHSTNTLTLDTSLSWSSGQGIGLAYEGDAPDIGAYEYSGSVPPPYCGDDSCNGAETCTSCPGDCGVCPSYCGDGNCDSKESCSSCPEDCGACQENHHETSVSEDTLIEYAYPDNDYGGADTFYIGSRNDDWGSRFLLKFPGLISSSAVPAGSTIESASLVLTHTGNQRITSPIDLKVRRVLESWKEGDSSSAADPGETTWNFRAYDTLSWTDAGCSAPGSHTTTGEVSKTYSTNPTEGSQSVFDVKSIVQSWADNGESSNNGFILLAPGQEMSVMNFVRFATSEYSNAAYRPKLVVDFSPDSVCGAADKDKNDVVDISELIIYINDWKSGNVGISELMDAIVLWKSGC